MAEIGRKGGFAKRGYRQDEQRQKTNAVKTEEGLGGEALADDGERPADITQVIASAQIPEPSLIEIPTPSQRRSPPRGHREGT